MNRSIVHLVESDGNYLCNKACSTTAQKTTTNKLDVTCKNCQYLMRTGVLIDK